MGEARGEPAAYTCAREQPDARLPTAIESLLSLSPAQSLLASATVPRFVGNHECAREWCDPTQSCLPMFCLHTTSASASVNHVGSPERAGQLRKQDRHQVQKKTTLMQVTQVSKKTWSTCMAVARMVVTRATALPADELVSSKSPSDSIPVCCDN